MAVKAFISWSSGKDSAFALTEALRGGAVDIIGALTTLNEAHGRVAMHGVRDLLLARQLTALGLPCLRVPLPDPCPMPAYEARMEAACAAMKARGATHVVFGDIFLADVRAYREAQLARAGMTGLFPLWGRGTQVLARTMIAEGLIAHIACLDPRHLDRRFAGRRFNHHFLADLPAGVDPCGERGEFHTAVTAGPMFRAPIPVTIGETVEREGFVFTDIIPHQQRNPTAPP